MSQAQVLGCPNTIEIFYDRVSADAERVLAIVDELCQPIVTSAQGMSPEQQRKLKRQGWPMVSRYDPHSEVETWQFFNANSPYWQFYLCVLIDGRREINAELKQGNAVLWKREYVGTIWPHPLTESECRLQAICSFANPIIIEQLISVVRYVLAIERGRELADKWQESAVTRFSHKQEPERASDLVDLGMLEQITILNERLIIGAKSLFSLLQEWFASPMPIWSSTYSSESALLPNGTFWQFTSSQFSNTQLNIDVILFENLDNTQKLRLNKETVGRISSFNVSDQGNESQVEIVAHYRHPEICGFLVDLTGNILNRVYGWEWGRLDEWRKENKARILSSQPQNQVQLSGQTQERHDSQQSKNGDLGNARNNRRKVLIGLLLVSTIALVLFVPTLLSVIGVLPYSISLVLWLLALAVGGATTFLAQWNNILALIEKLFSKR